MKKWQAGAAILLVLALISFFVKELSEVFAGREPESVLWVGAGSVSPGQLVPGFRAKDVAGIEYDFTASKRVRIINFWASWCGPCLEELPSLLKLASDFKGKVEIVLISEDKTLKEMRAALTMYPAEAQANARWLMDSNKRISLAYGVQGLPESFIVSADGKLLQKVVGALKWTDSEITDFLTLQLSR